MSQPNFTEDETATTRPERRFEYPLRACFDLLRSLRSTWGVLSHFVLATDDHYITLAGRALNDEIAGLITLDAVNRDEQTLPKINRQLASLVHEMGSIADHVTLEQLQSVVPARTRDDRRGVLDLLDLLLTSVIDRPTSFGRTAAVDYLITELCINAGNPGELQDPTTLTSKLYGLCEMAANRNDSGIPEIEAEFLTAANQIESESTKGEEPSDLLRRKNQLGEDYFVPEVLRAIIAYNAARLRGTDARAARLQDWGHLEAEAPESDPNARVFETTALPRLADAVRRRAAGEPPRSEAIDRVAWSIDLAFPNHAERAILLSPDVGLQSNIAGTAILVGLLCRSAEALAEEFEPIGISPTMLAGEWAEELNYSLTQEINQLIVGDGYDHACVLTSLRTKFLYSPMAEAPTLYSASVSAQGNTKSAAQQFRDEARSLASQAIMNHRPIPSQPKKDWRAQQWSRILPILGAGVCSAMIAFAFYRAGHPSDELTRLDSESLAIVSPFFAAGRQSVEGTGGAFVGRIDHDWFRLNDSERQKATNQIVEALRARGVREIMIYDDQHSLRIQALGHQPVRIMPLKWNHPEVGSSERRLQLAGNRSSISFG